MTTRWSDNHAVPLDLRQSRQADHGQRHDIMIVNLHAQRSPKPIGAARWAGPGAAAAPRDEQASQTNFGRRLRGTSRRRAAWSAASCRDARFRNTKRSLLEAWRNPTSAPPLAVLVRAGVRRWRTSSAPAGRARWR